MYAGDLKRAANFTCQLIRLRVLVRVAKFEQHSLIIGTQDGITTFEDPFSDTKLAHPLSDDERNSKKASYVFDIEPQRFASELKQPASPFYGGAKRRIVN